MSWAGSESRRDSGSLAAAPRSSPGPVVACVTLSRFALAGELFVPR